ncbi:MAG: hypothetical protein L0H53_07530 [Candidatus Nitrosocosmicus sp.]|nr:hypothetical protein [Candidatus Nitrosocosmicus sp.]MDN5867417.1 hypothetical protein [Candidatus Nitrosocosmicus sp.]
MYNSKIYLLLAIFVTTLSSLATSTAVADSLPSLGEKSSGPTFDSEGTINTLTGVNHTWLLGGQWDFQVINGVTDTFNIDITMIAENGTMRHHMVVTNFTQPIENKVNVTDDGNIDVKGTSDIYGHGKLLWRSVPSEISIDKYNVLHLQVGNNQTEGHFEGGIHGITNSFTYGFNFNKESGGLH